MQIKQKLQTGFILALLILISLGVTSWLLIANLSTATNTALGEKTRQLMLATRISQTTRSIVSDANLYLLNINDLGKSRARIDDQFVTLNEELSGLKQVDSSIEIEELNLQFDQFSEHISNLLDAHDQLSVYLFDFEGQRYDMGAFADRIYAESVQWSEKLEEAARYEILFKENTNASNSTYARWVKYFSTTDEKLEKSIQQYKKFNIRLHKLAEKVNGGKSEKKLSLFKRAKARIILKARAALISLRKHSVLQVSTFVHFENEMAQFARESGKSMLHLTDQLAHQATQAMESERAFVNSTQKTAKILLITFVFGASVIIFIIGFLTIRAVVIPVKNLVAAINHTSTTSDLTISMPDQSKDELGQIGRELNAMLEGFRQIITEAKHSSTVLNQTCGDLGSIIVKGKDSIDQQTQKSNCLAVAIEELSASANSIKSQVDIASSSASKAHSEASSGSQVVALSTDAVSSLAGHISKASNVISQLHEDSQSVNSVLEVIQSIAEQTNLLALNAAIEAARAGEQGRGFAVVADEVRTLANRTHGSTEDVRRILSRLSEGAESAQQLINLGQEKAEKNVGQAEIAGSALATIVTAASGIDAASNEAAQSAGEQAKVITQLSSNVHELSELSDNSARDIAETVRISENLAQLATSLEASVNQFSV